MRTLLNRSGLVAVGTALSLLVCVGAAQARMDEGMWPLNGLPTVKLAEHGFAPTEEFLKAMQRAAVYFGGASGSFVSAEGLVMTNHHVGADALSELSTPERDLLVVGFTAKARSEELKCPGMTVSIVETITDVTARVLAAVNPGMSDGAAESARKAAIETIEREATAEAKKAMIAKGPAEIAGVSVRGEVVPLFNGGKFNLHVKKIFTDVRLVFAPEGQAANFGGDGENFEFPRHGLDCCFFRVYGDDKPYAPESYLKRGGGSDAGAREGELGLVFGHPGRTQRLLTMDDIKFQRDIALPSRLAFLWRQEIKGQSFVNRGPDELRTGTEELLGWANSRKGLTGQFAGLHDPELMAGKQAAEDKLVAAISKNPEWEVKWGDAIGNIADAVGENEAIFAERALWATRDSGMLRTGVTLVELAHELGKPEAEREAAYKGPRLASLIEGLGADKPVHASVEQYGLENFLLRVLETTGGEYPPAVAMLAGKSPAARAMEIISGTKLMDPKAVRALAEGGAKAIEASGDLLLVLARQVFEQQLPLTERFEKEISPKLKANYAKLASARFATLGDSVYPDANSSLRLSFGKIVGFMERGVKVPPFTTFGSLLAKADSRGKVNRDFELTERWQSARGKLNPATPFNFVLTADIIGGNSGSPVVNVKGELIGLIFDGNIQSLPGAFAYDMTQNRAVAVDLRAIREAIAVVYGAGEIADEIGR